MTTTAGAPQTEQPPPPQEPPTEEAILAALVLVLLATQPLAAATAQVQSLLGSLGIGAQAAELATGLAFGAATTYSLDGLASAHVRRTGTPRRAAYLLNAAKRLHAGIRDGEPTAALQQERIYLGQHLNAERSRVEAAKRVDLAAAEHGPVLGWKARMDDATTRACRAAHGADFRADRAPTLPQLEEGHRLVGFPGTLHGGSCRCIPAPPYGSGRMLE